MEKFNVMVLGNDKQMYEVADFASTGKTYKDAVGILFGTETIGVRVLAFDSWHGPWGTCENIICEPHNESQAVQILSGIEDTKRVAEAQANLEEMTAAKWCWNYQKGDFQWYQPSVMELGALFLVQDQVNCAMEVIRCERDFLLPTTDSENAWVLSSSEGGKDGSWSVHFGNGQFGCISKQFKAIVRAVTIPFNLSPQNFFQKKTKIKDSKLSDQDLVDILRSRGYSGDLTKILSV